MNIDLTKWEQKNYDRLITNFLRYMDIDNGEDWDINAIKDFIRSHNADWQEFLLLSVGEQLNTGEWV